MMDHLEPIQRRLVRLGLAFADDGEMAATVGCSLSTIRRHRALAVAAVGAADWRDLLRNAQADGIQPEPVVRSKR